ncbi:unnamed protein product [Phaedon cochleariae]|uniref:RRM domain-containing protein n=1 Tax=Phaedon cochleariae TaxID=80249 RepID=A0A9P0DQ83_PHACE|nr:unnamed protein product [Phaedon cochleariae]
MSSRLFVGGLTQRIRERDIEKFFRKFGKIKEISLKNGYAFVEFGSSRDAEDATYELNGRELLGERITVERARGTPRGSDHWRDRERSGGRRSYGGPPPRSSRAPRGRERSGTFTRTEYRVIVENLSSRTSWQDLKEFMQKGGEVAFADAHKLVPGQGVVEFMSYSDMKNAIDKLDDTELNGRRIKMAEDRRGPRRRSSSRSRSRSRQNGKSMSRSRSRSHSKEDSRRRSSSRSRSRSRQNGKSMSRSRSRSHSKEDSRRRSRSRSEERE